MRRTTGSYLAVLMLSWLTVSSFANDIVTMPTANQMKKGTFEIAYYHVDLDFPPGAPSTAEIQTIDMGITDDLELNVNRYDIDAVGNSTIINASMLLMPESAKMPNVVIGARNLGGALVGGAPKSDKTSWYVAAAKTLNPPVQGPPKCPLVRLHVGFGTDDYSVLGEARHGGLFGGVQALLAPEIGAVVAHDSTDLITCLTYMPSSSMQVRTGWLGDHWFLGLSWSK